MEYLISNAIALLLPPGILLVILLARCAGAAQRQRVFDEVIGIGWYYLRVARGA